VETSLTYRGRYDVPHKTSTPTRNDFSTHHHRRLIPIISPHALSSIMSKPTSTSSDNNSSKWKTSSPPDGYVCHVCGVAGHWIQQCSNRPKKRTKKSNHVFVAGVDPSEADIERARELQKIKPPNCFCGATARLKKVKRSTKSETSRAIGKYFFFCAKHKTDNTKCHFARPVEDERKPKKERLGSHEITDTQ
jgi:Zinc knuckle